MRTFVFSPPVINPDAFPDDVAIAWEVADPNLEQLADSTLSAWQRLLHAHAQLCEAGDALAGASVAQKESAEAVAEASLALRYQAHMTGEIEYLDEIAADTLPEALARIARSRPPDGLVEVHQRLWERERIWLEDRDAATRAALFYTCCWRRLVRAERRFARRRENLRHAVRRARVVRRAA